MSPYVVRSTKDDFWFNSEQKLPESDQTQAGPCADLPSDRVSVENCLAAAGCSVTDYLAVGDPYVCVETMPSAPYYSYA